MADDWSRLATTTGASPAGRWNALPCNPCSPTSDPARSLSRVETTLTAKIDHVDEKLGNFENREIDKRLQLEVRVERLEKQRS